MVRPSFTLICLLLACATHAFPATIEARTAPLPEVDLGYVVQRATVFNDSGQYYNFSNIRYAQPPTGDLRFRAPEPPLKDRLVVRTGEIGRICPQATPGWSAYSATWIAEYLLLNKTAFNSSEFPAIAQTPSQDSRITEDCLFLDVQVPKEIFDKGKRKHYKGAPVMVWIYGGGFTTGQKAGSGSPAGLLSRSKSRGSDGMVFVALNYRLGAFGWLSGPTFQDDGTANAGLYDQRLAIKWIKQNIRKFGGDPDRITLVGESAGGSSIMHQITAYGGNKPVSFQQAIAQSPGFAPAPSPAVQEASLVDFLALLNVSTIEEARKLPFSVLNAANVAQVGATSWGENPFGPVVDGIFAPQLPSQLLAKGQFAKEVKVMVGHNAMEGLAFTSPLVQTEADLISFLALSNPTISAFPEYERYVRDVLYPSANYPNMIARASAIVSETGFTCNTHYLNKALHNSTYAYYFTIPPALHGQDVAYTFYNDQGNITSVTTPEIAIVLQEYITSFVNSGNPNEEGVEHFPVYGKNATVQVLGAKGVTQAVDDTWNARCEWWQKALYY